MEGHFNTVDETQMEFQVVLDSLQERTSMVLFRYGKDSGITVYIPKGTILKGMVSKFK